MPTSTDFRAPPRRRGQIRNKAFLIRQITGRENVAYFPILRLLEHELPEALEGFAFLQEYAEVMGDRHAYTLASERTIVAREDVYERAVEERGRDRLTLAHELGHLMLHANIGMARSPGAEVLKRYERGEWQADCFAGELLIPYHLRDQFSSPEHVANACGVSVDAARFHWTKVWRQST